MPKNKITLDFAGFETIKKQLDQLGGDATKRAIDEALKASQQIVAQKVSAAMAPHNFTGKTTKSIVYDDPVEWTGDTAAVGVGFNIRGGGLPSIFLMYGTKLHGQPHITPDRNLYEAVYGANTRKEIQRVQEAAFDKVLNEVIRNEK